MKLKSVLGGAAGCFLLWLLASYTAGEGWDFKVFYYSVRAILEGHSPYRVGLESGWTFKYPPWNAILILPLTFLPVHVAQWVWGVIQAGCIVSVIQWTRKCGVSLHTALISAALYWWIWMYHCLAGQFTLVMLALALWAPAWGEKKSAQDPLRLTAVLWALSAKVFTVFPLVGLLNRTLRDRFFKESGFIKQACIAGGLLAVLSVPVIAVMPGHSPVRAAQEFMVGAGSSSSGTDNEVFRGRRNQGLPALVMRVLNVDVSRVGADVFLFLVFGLLLGTLWLKICKRLPWPSQWAGWLSLSVVVHPMAWFHSFVLAYPCACLALDNAFKTESRRKRQAKVGLALLGILLTTAATRNSLGRLGVGLELISVKSLGVLMCLTVLQWQSISSSDVLREHARN